MTREVFLLLSIDGYKMMHTVQDYGCKVVMLILIFCFFQWISDKDLMHMAQSLGVMDIIEIKFAENKINGQSRG